jgi:D-apionolactonase
MKTFARYVLWHGRDEPPTETHELRAGPITAILEGSDLRHIRLGAVELAQRIYMAVRDDAWNTIPGEYSDFEYHIHDSDFRIGFSGRHLYGHIDYEWRATIVGTDDGTISYAMDGIAHASFRHNKIGFNVHHPLPESVGQPFRANTPDGELSGTIPEYIDPQRVVNGTLTAMFPAYDSIVMSTKGGVDVRFDFEGDLFEMQDHRNWTDANFKSYGTPLSVPYPIHVEPGQRIHQKVTVSVVRTPDVVPSPASKARIELGSPTGLKLPPIGVGLTADGGSLSKREADLLRALRFDHVRVDLHLKDQAHEQELERGAATSQAIGAGLEIALFLSGNAQSVLGRFAPLLSRLNVQVKQILVLEEAEGFSTFRTMTPGSLVRMARERLGDAAPGAVFAGGTDQFFTELNRDWSQADETDAIVYSLNPQVHACDSASIMENLAGQTATVASTRHFSGGKPVFVSPVTFIGRSGPFPAGPPRQDGLPPTVDVRQASLFGAAWTVGSIKALAEIGAASVTYFETTGWKGIIERDAGSPLPDHFPSTPGSVFPLYHVFADVARWKDGELLEAGSNDVDAITALALRARDGTHLLVANLRPHFTSVEIGPFIQTEVGIRRLDEDTAPIAMTDPERFRNFHESRSVRDGLLALELSPYAVLRVDAE